MSPEPVEIETLELRRNIFHDAGQHYADYFWHYTDEHRDDWLELKTEYANLLVTAQYCRDHGDYKTLVALRDALQPHLDLQGHWIDALTLNEWATAAARASGDQVSVARYTHDRADILNQLGEYRQAEGLYQASEETYLALGEKGMALRSRHMRALVIRAQGRLTQADRLCETTIADAQQLGLERWLAHPLYVRALLARDRGDFNQAGHWIHEGLARLADSDERALIAQCHHFLGELALLQRSLTESRAHLEISLQLSQEVGILRRVAATQRLLGDVARAEGHDEEADTLYRKALALASQLGDRHQQARVLLARARLIASHSRKQEAIGLLESAKAIYQAIGDSRGVVGTSLLLLPMCLAQRRLNMALQHGYDALKVAWATGLLRPSVLIGIMRRRVKW